MSWKLEDLQLINFAHPSMQMKPPLFDFEKHGHMANDLGNILHKKMLELRGMGLSANQVGLPYRVFVFGTTEQKYVLFNPLVIGVSKEQTLMKEGCISFPKLMLTLKRPAEVLVEYQDDTGTVQHTKFKNLAARVVLHEYDYMEGINFTHHASNFKLRLEVDKLKKRQQKMAKKIKHKGQHVRQQF